ADAGRAERDLRRFLDDRITSPFDLSDSCWAQLRKNGFAVGAETANDMYEFLDQQYPCVTTDQCLHTFHALIRSAFGELDSLVMGPRLLAFSRAMRKACLETSKRSNDRDIRHAALRGAQYFAVAEALLAGGSSGTEGLPVWSKAQVEAELLQIRAHAGIGP